MKEPINFNLVSDIYDSYVTHDEDIPFFLEETKNEKGRILELMCGTGRVSVPMLEAGRQLVCVDYSPGMLEEFSRKIQDKRYPVKLVNADVTEISLGERFNLVLIPFHSFSEILEQEKQQRALSIVSEHLSGTGTFICTLQNPRKKIESADGRIKTLGSFPFKGGRVVVSLVNRYDEKNKLINGFQYYEIYDSEGRPSEKRTLEINFKPVKYGEFKVMAEKAGLSVKKVYGDYSYSEFDEQESNFMIIILEKKPQEIKTVYFP